MSFNYTQEVSQGGLQLCKKCGLPIYEGHAYELGDDRWHINCFKCSKCSSSLGCNSNFLVLGNGLLICSNCLYNCKQCGKKIDDLAILTGDQAYCSSCFKCRSCKLKIEDLRYARTSKGLFCMSCHEKLVAKKKKVDMRKRQKELEERRVDPRFLSDISNVESRRLSMYSHKELPVPPPGDEVPVRPASIRSHDSTERPIVLTKSSETLVPLMDLERGPSVETQRTSEREEPAKDEFKVDVVLQETPASVPGSVPTDMKASDFSIEEINDSDDELNRRGQDVILDIIDSMSEPGTPKSNLQPPVNITPQSHHQSPPQQSEKLFRGKNLLILSPNQFHDHEFHSAKSNMSPINSPNKNLAVADDPRLRLNCPSPMARANRQARVVETNEDGTAEDDFGFVTTPRKKRGDASVLSPPPRRPVPSTPVRNTPVLSYDTPPMEPRGLGLEGVDYDAKRLSHVIGNTTPAITNLEETIDAGDETPKVLRRSTLIRTPKLLSLKHKRSVSNGSTSGKFGFFKNNERGHSRHVSEGLINGLAFTTPPLPLTLPINQVGFREHMRLTSDTPFVDSKLAQDTHKAELELRLLKSDVYQYETQKGQLHAELRKLNAEKARVADVVKQAQQKAAAEAQKLEELKKEVHSLELRKAKLLEINQSLSEENHALELTLRKPDDKSLTNLTLNSSLSLVTPLEEDHETHKATRLKFWRRPKVAHVGGDPMLELPVSDEKKGLGSFITKSRSTNILDTFITPSELVNSQDAPLFSSTIQRRADYENERVPLIVLRCLQEVEARGLDMEGIYRISGGNSATGAIEQAFSSMQIVNGKPDERSAARLNEAMDVDINAVTSALKRYFRKLPDPLIPFGLYDEFVRVSQTRPEERIPQLQKLVGKLPPANRETLFVLCKHLSLVNSYKEVNRMGIKNLSVVFAPTISRDATGEREMIDMGHRNDTTETLLGNYEKIFT